VVEAGDVNFLHLDPEELARQITLRDFALFARIYPLEFVLFFWQSKKVWSGSFHLTVFTKNEL
jgi:hypothetical protein